MRRWILMVGLTVGVAACGGGDAAVTTSSLSPTTTTTTTAVVAPATTPPTTQEPETTSAAEADSPAAVFIAQYGDVGDCSLVSYIVTGDDFDYGSVPERVSCDQPHDQQIFFVGELEGASGAPYPGDDLFDIVFGDLCEEPFQRTYGVPSDIALSLELWAVWPLEAEWAAGLRTAKCSVAAPGNSFGEGQLVGDASSAGLTLSGHAVATVAEFDLRDLFIWYFGADGEIPAATNLTLDGFDVSEGSSSPSWSPDLSKITYAAELPDGNVDVFVVEVATGEKAQITSDPGRDTGPTFSPDGTKIAFSSDRNGAETSIFVMNPDGSDPVQLTFHDDRDSSPDWSPDGERIVFRRRSNGNSDIWTMDADGSSQSFLVGGPGGEFDPDWSPDGTTVAFISDENGDFDIWTFPAEGIITIGAPPSVAAAGATRITDHPGNEEYPEWTPDGEFMLFMADRHGVPDVWMMRSDGSDQSALLFTYPVGWPQVVLSGSQ